MMKLVLAATALLISGTAFAQSAYTPLPEQDVALLDSVTRNCGTSHMEYREDQTGLNEPNQISLAQNGGETGSYVHIYSQEMSDAILAAARQMNVLGWVVTDTYYADTRLKDRVLTGRQFAELKSGEEKIKCMVGPDPIPMCNDDERRIARELFGIETLTPCGEEKPWDRSHPNALRTQHVRMLRALLDNGYSYNEATRAFEKSGGESGQGTIAPAYGSR